MGGPAVKFGPPSGGFPAAYLAALGIMAALRVRDRSGVGQRVDVALIDAAVLPLLSREQEFWLGRFSTEPLGKADSAHKPESA